MDQSLARLGLELRAAQAADEIFLRALYRSFRTAEVAAAPWPNAVISAFVDNQFALQHRHFTREFPDADFLIVMLGGEPIGRLYLHRRDDALHVVDIGLDPLWRGRGVGRALLQWSAELARREGLARVTLAVASDNPRAFALYRRLGFRTGERLATHLIMALEIKNSRPVS